MINPYLFVFKHITKESADKLIYGVSLNGTAYFLSKTLYITDCRQIDSRPLLAPVVFMELYAIITEIESVYSEHPSLDMTNRRQE